MERRRAARAVPHRPQRLHDPDRHGRGRPGKRLREDQRLVDELEICASGWLPHRIFLGAPWPAPGEPLWTDEDAAKALGYLHHLRGICPDCGEHRADWHDEHGKELRDPPRELVDVLCPSCEILEDEKHERREKGHPKHGKRGLKMAWRWIRGWAASEDE